jgi:large subunit ribosomal protein L3
MSRIALIGKKLGMTNMFDGHKIIPVTLVKVLPNVVVETRKYDNKYGLVLAGNEIIKESKINKPQRSELARKNIKPHSDVCEFSFKDEVKFANGTEMSVGDYLLNAFIDVRSHSIGKGFQGVMKRYGFGGMPASHGHSLSHRSLGSTGNRTLPGRVFKGKKMAGHMGDKNVCVQNLVICAVDKDINIIAVRGSIPGKENTVVYITNALKKNVDNNKMVNGLACEG